MTHYTNTTTKPRSRRRQARRYPNAATAQQILARWTDRILCCAAWVGLTAAILFLATI